MDTSAIRQREHDVRRLEDLRRVRTEWDAQYLQLARYFMPEAGRFLTRGKRTGGTREEGDAAIGKLLDTTGLRSQNVLSAGMMSSATSPARPWFAIETPHKDLNRRQPVKVWLREVTDILLSIFSRANTYRALHQGYKESGVFGTEASVLMDDFRNVVHHHTLTVGEYFLATDYLGNVDTLAREFDMTVAQVVRWFGLENTSHVVRQLYERRSLSEPVRVVHLIEPRDKGIPGSRFARDMPWRSVYFEPGAPADHTLRESGFDSFPALCSRWDVLGADPYGSNSPAMAALGLARGLQQEHLRKAQAIDYQTRPPLQAPTSMRDSESQFLPGGVTYYDGTTPGAGVRTAFDVNLRLDHLLADIQDAREQVKASFYADLWLALEQVTQGRMTAYEVAERKEEKLLMLGPTAERLHTEKLAPLVATTFARALRAGILSAPPPDLDGVELTINFVSVLAQAQRAVGLNSIDRYVASLGTLAAVKPGVLDKFDEDAWADEYADKLGLAPSLIVPSDKVALIRAERAKAAQQQQEAELTNTAADTAQKLGAANTGGNNALADITRNLTGYT